MGREQQMSIDFKARKRASSWGLISGVALCALSAGSGLAADIFPCEDLLRHLERGGIDTGEANRSQRWRTNLDAMEIIAPDGASKKDTMRYRMSGEVDVGSVLVATISFQGGSGGSVPIRGRWLSPAPMSIDNDKLRCTKEVVENIPLNAAADFKLTLKNPEDVSSSKGKWRFVLYTQNRTILQYAEYDIRPLPNAQEKKERWLAEAYENYLLLDRCVELYAASLPKSQYRSAMSAIESAAKKQSIDTDAVWKRVNEDNKDIMQTWAGFVASRASMSYEQRSNVRDLCGLASRALIGQAHELQPAGSTPKKDF
jgi:hypothetical protein